MEQILKIIETKTTEIFCIIFFAGMGAAIYMLYSNESMRLRFKSAALGWFISCTFSPAFYWALHIENMIALMTIAATLAVAGQFLPEMISVYLRKYVKNKADSIVGEDNDN